MRNTFFGAAVTAALSVTSFAADAGTVGPGTYQIEDAKTKGETGHGLYLNGFFADPSYDSRRWSIVDGTATVSDDALGFSATVENSWANVTYGGDYSFELEAGLIRDNVTDQAPYCQNNACAGISPGDVDYFNSDVDSGYFATLTGMRDLTGMIISLFVNDVGGDKPPQLGLGGSWFAANMAMDGFATWLTWSQAEFIQAVSLFDDCQVSCNGPWIGSSGSGDINWLVGDPVNEIPLPAAGWLLIAGLGGLAAVKRRKA